MQFKPYHVSSIDNPSEWIPSMKERGYLFFKQFFTQSEVPDIRKKIVEALYKEEWITSMDESHTVKEPVKWINSPEFHSCIDRFMQIEELHQLGKHPALMRIMAHLLGETPFAHPRKMIRTSWPIHLNKIDLIPPHQDIFYVRGEVDTFTVWTPLGNYPLEKGGLKMASGSHKRSLIPCSKTDQGRFECKLSDIDESQFDWHHSPVEMGDILVFHSLTLHGAIPNQGNQVRVSMDCRFSAASGVINEEQLTPPYRPHVRDWPELSKGWKEPNFFDVPSTLTVQPASLGLLDVIKRPSKYVESYVTA